jgi:hypothetical protein
MAAAVPAAIPPDELEDDVDVSGLGMVDSEITLSFRMMCDLIRRMCIRMVCIQNHTLCPHMHARAYPHDVHSHTVHLYDVHPHAVHPTTHIVCPQCCTFSPDLLKQLCL